MDDMLVPLLVWGMPAVVGVASESSMATLLWEGPPSIGSSRIRPLSEALEGRLSARPARGIGAFGAGGGIDTLARSTWPVDGSGSDERALWSTEGSRFAEESE
jgi:hypothetical protein